MKAPVAGAEGEILRAEIEFCRETAVEGSDGWAQWFAEDGSQLPEGKKPVTGQEDIRNNMKGFLATPGLVFYWNASHAEVMPNGLAGITVGRYRMEIPDKEGKVSISTGSYITVWRKQKDGSWKVFADTGAPDGAKPSAPKAKVVPLKEKK
jgi:ketosteroid isomerase-like protein